MEHARSFAIVLVRPQIPENAGFAARSMKAFGFDDLRIVGDPGEWGLSSPAFRTASGAEDRLLNMAVFESVEEAVADCHRAFGFSRREHQIHRKQYTLCGWRNEMANREDGARTALLFGPEDAGLTNEDLSLCDGVVEIPMHCPTLSLNLSHAVTVALYELTRGAIDPVVSIRQPKPVDKAHSARLVDEAIELLYEKGFFKTGREEYQENAIRDLIQRVELADEEFPTVMGALRALRGLKRRRRSGEEE